MNKILIGFLTLTLFGCNAEIDVNVGSQPSTTSPSVQSPPQDPPNVPTIPTNHVPILNIGTSINGSENSPLSIDLQGSDEDGDTLTFSCTGCPTGLSLNGFTGVFDWTPSYTQAGTHTVTFTVDDGTDQTDAVVDFIISNTNR